MTSEWILSLISLQNGNGTWLIMPEGRAVLNQSKIKAVITELLSPFLHDSFTWGLGTALRFSDLLDCWWGGAWDSVRQAEESCTAAVGRTGPLLASVFSFLCDLGQLMPVSGLHFRFPRLSLLLHPCLLDTYGGSHHPRMAAHFTPGRNQILTWTTQPTWSVPIAFLTLPTSLLCDSCFASATLTLMFPLPLASYICIIHLLTPFQVLAPMSSVTFSIMPTWPPYWTLQSIHQYANFQLHFLSPHPYCLLTHCILY